MYVLQCVWGVLYYSMYVLQCVWGVTAISDLVDVWLEKLLTFFFQFLNVHIIIPWKIVHSAPMVTD